MAVAVLGPMRGRLVKLIISIVVGMEDITKVGQILFWDLLFSKFANLVFDFGENQIVAIAVSDFALSHSAAIDRRKNDESLFFDFIKK